MYYKVWQNAWKENYSEPLRLELPDSWDVELCSMEGDSWPALKKEQLREKIDSPIGSQSIKSLARNGKDAVIVFDDLSRGTPVRDIAEIVLEELLEGGIKKDHIRFICALGTHGAHTRSDFVKKLGEYIVENYPVFNHNPYEQCVKIGTDFAGRDVEINREFYECDVRIGIGSVAPHPMNGYGGGGKLLFPGIASINTTFSNHSRREFGRIGDKGPCGLRREIENMTGMAGQFFKIDAVLNAKLDIVDLYAGDPIAEYYAAVESSSVANAMKLTEPKDVVIVNSNAKSNEALIAITIANMILKKGGDIVMINHCPAGQVVHYLFGNLGLNFGGKCWAPHSSRPKKDMKHIIYFTPYPDFTSRYIFDEPEKVVFAKTWDAVLDLLSSHGAGTSASIISDGSISYFPELLKK
jgi:nickel-dependent lactate racemase